MVEPLSQMVTRRSEFVKPNDAKIHHSPLIYEKEVCVSFEKWPEQSLVMLGAEAERYKLSRELTAGGSQECGARALLIILLHFRENVRTGGSEVARAHTRICSLQRAKFTCLFQVGLNLAVIG